MDRLLSIRKKFPLVDSRLNQIHGVHLKFIKIYRSGGGGGASKVLVGEKGRRCKLTPPVIVNLRDETKLKAKSMMFGNSTIGLEI